MKLKKTVISIVAGILYGYFSFWWLIFSLAFAFPENSLGSRDWEEDVMFIPMGYGMFLFYIGLWIVFWIKKRREKNYFLLFSISTIIMGMGVFFSKLYL